MKHLLLTTIAAVLLVGCYPLFIAADAVIAPQNFSIHKAARVGHIKAVKRNLASGTNVNAKDEDGVTPLLLAAMLGHKEIAKLLIAKGAHLNAKDDVGKLGRTPLDWTFGKKEIADLLRKHGAKRGKELKAEGK